MLRIAERYGSRLVDHHNITIIMEHDSTREAFEIGISLYGPEFIWNVREKKFYFIDGAKTEGLHLIEIGEKNPPVRKKISHKEIYRMFNGLMVKYADYLVQKELG